MPKLSFFDVKTKTKFTTDNFKVITMKNGRKAAKAKAPSGATAMRFLSKDFKK